MNGPRDPPETPPPFMVNAILNFHFDFLKPSLIDLPCFFTRHLCIEFSPQQEVKPFTVPCTAGSVCVCVCVSNETDKEGKKLQRQDKIDVNMKRHLILTTQITILIHML